MHSRPYRGPQSEIIRREPLFLIWGRVRSRRCTLRDAFGTRKGGTPRGCVFRMTSPEKNVPDALSKRNVCIGDTVSILYDYNE